MGRLSVTATRRCGWASRLKTPLNPVDLWRRRPALSQAGCRDRPEENVISADWFGLACEFHCEGQLIRGFVRSLSHSDFYVETTAPLEPDRELEARLVGGAASRPVYVRVIVGKSFAEGALDPESPACVQFRLVLFSVAYAQLIAGHEVTERSEETRHSPVESVKRKEERFWLSEILGVEPPTVQPGTKGPSVQWEEYEPLPERAGVPLWSEESLAPEAILIDDGELDDVARILSDLRVKIQRQSPTGDAFLATWTPPRRLLVVTARRALRHRLPLKSGSSGLVSVVVAESDARTLSSEMRRRGFRYAISRPIHPLVMEMLIRQTTFAGDDGRTESRSIVGAAVRWWCGWGRKRPGVLLDVSSRGCRLAVQEFVSRGSRIKIRIPEGLGRGAGITLMGRVVRAARGSGETTLGISFEELPVGVHDRLRRILTLPGPCRATEETAWLVGDSSATRSQCATTVSPPEPPDQKGGVAFRQEVVALDQESNRVKHLLVSTHLTLEGMQIEAHPELNLGERLELALYEDAEAGPLLLAGVVARDEGPGGWWIRFVDLPTESSQRLAQILDRSPPLACLEMTDGELGRLVLGQLVVQGDDAP